MPRTIKEPAARRNDILDVAQRLVYSIGYEQMTIQDILDELKISKGAFYHYFSSKDALLEALILRIGDQVEQIIIAIVEDPNLPAIDKFQRYFDSAVQWKSARKTLLMALLRVWYIDGNALLRQKVMAEGARRVLPMLTQIVHQGLREGIFSNPYPDQVGEVIFTLMMGLSESISRILLNLTPDPDPFRLATDLLASYTYTIELVLGAPPGSFILMEPNQVKEWLAFSAEPVS